MLAMPVWMSQCPCGCHCACINAFRARTYITVPVWMLAVPPYGCPTHLRQKRRKAAAGKRGRRRSSRRLQQKAVGMWRAAEC